MLVGFPFASSQEDIPAFRSSSLGPPQVWPQGLGQPGSNSSTGLTAGLSRDSEPLGPVLGSEKEEALSRPFPKSPA